MSGPIERSDSPKTKFSPQTPKVSHEPVQSENFETMPTFWEILFSILFWPAGIVLAIVKADKWSTTTKANIILIGMFWPLGLIFTATASDLDRKQKNYIYSIFGVSFVATILIWILIGIFYISSDSSSLTPTDSYDTNSATYFSTFDINSVEARNLYEEADTLDTEGKYTEAYLKILEARKADPDSEAIQYLECYIQNHTGDSLGALDVCLDLVDGNENNPFLMSQLANINWNLDRCDTAAYYALKLKDISDIDEEDIRILYGNAGLILAYCDISPEDARMYLEEALSRTDDPDLEYIYQDALDSLENPNSKY